MKNIEEIFNKACKNHKENNFGSAEKLYNKILTINSNHFKTNFTRYKIKVKPKTCKTLIWPAE